MGCFLKLLKLNEQLLEKQTRLQKIKIKEKNLYLNFMVSRKNQRGVFLLKTAGLKLMSRQEEIVFATVCSNDILLVKTTPMKLYFMFPLEVPTNNI